MQCSMLGILVPQPGIKHTSPALAAQSLNHWTTREVPKCKFDLSNAPMASQQLSGSSPNACHGPTVWSRLWSSPDFLSVQFLEHTNFFLSLGPLYILFLLPRTLLPLRFPWPTFTPLLHISLRRTLREASSECLHPILSPNQSTLGPYATLVLETSSVSL